MNQTVALGAANSIVDSLEKTNEIAGDKLFLTWFDDNGMEAEHLTFAELRNQAANVAGLLEKKHNVKKSDRVVIMLPPGLDFYSAFLGCLYLGAVPVPIYPPVPGFFDRDLPKIEPIVLDCGAKVILTITNYILAFKFYRFRKKIPWLKGIQFASLSFEHSPASIREIKPEDVAFIQYTSGSTADPKGVVVTHGILIEQTKMVTLGLRVDESTSAVSWLPPYHDYGLCGGFLSSLYSRSQLYLFSPLTFLKNPLLWLKIVELKKATHIAGPNFSYGLCTRKWAQDMKELDLSSLNYIQSAAEPIQIQTMNDFLQTFKIPKSKFYPCYGMAEHVAYICDKVPNDNLEIIDRIISCGTPRWGVEFKIVTPDTVMECLPGQVGEIWIHSPSLAAGYWNKPEKTKEIFGAHLKDSNKKYLRTGDLGFLLDNRIFITGREKDLIIIAGKNYYPQDFEHTIESHFKEIRPGCIAVFSIDLPSDKIHACSEEKIVIVAEINKLFQKSKFYEDLSNKIYQKIFSIHQQPIHSIIFLQDKSIPKTTSGKIRRKECKQKFIENKFEKKLYKQEFFNEYNKNKSLDILKKDKNYEDTFDLIVNIIHNFIRIEKSEIVNKSFLELGIDSLAVISIHRTIETESNISFPISILFESENVHNIVVSILNINLNSKNINNSVDYKKKYPLLDTQMNHWVSRFGNLNYLGKVISFKIKLDIEKLEKVINSILQKNTIFFSKIFYFTMYQKIKPFTKFTLDIEDLTIKLEEEKKEFLLLYFQTISGKKLDLFKTPKFEAKLFKLSESHYEFMFFVPHIICDGYNLEMVSNWIIDLYNSKNLIDFKSKQLVPYIEEINKERLDNDNLYTADLLSNLKNFELFKISKTHHIKKNIFPHPVKTISTEIFKNFKDYCLKNKINTRSAILSLFRLSLIDINNKDKTIISAIDSNSKKVDISAMVGTYATCSITGVNMDINNSLIDFLYKNNLLYLKNMKLNPLSQMTCSFIFEEKKKKDFFVKIFDFIFKPHFFVYSALYWLIREVTKYISSLIFKKSYSYINIFINFMNIPDRKKINGISISEDYILQTYQSITIDKNAIFLYVVEKENDEVYVLENSSLSIDLKTLHLNKLIYLIENIHIFENKYIHNILS